MCPPTPSIVASLPVLRTVSFVYHPISARGTTTPGFRTDVSLRTYGRKPCAGRTIELASWSRYRRIRKFQQVSFVLGALDQLQPKIWRTVWRTQPWGSGAVVQCFARL